MSDFEWMLEIVNRAVLDWRALIRAKAWKRKELYRVTNADKLPHGYCNFAELRRFFKSDWCEMCLQLNHSSMSAPMILEKLEAELKAAKAKDDGKGIKPDAKREKQKEKLPENMSRKQCKGCAYFRTGHGDSTAMKFCHHYLDTGIRRKPCKGGKCLSKAEKARKLCKPFDVPGAQG